MLKSTVLAALGLLTLSGAAYAGDHQRFQATGPQPLMDVVDAGGGTVTGTVGTVAASGFVLSDGERAIPIASHDLLPEGIQAGDQITVVGGIRRGALQAERIIRQDGVAFGRDADQERPRRYADKD
jgi:cytochrome c-type biogenesis protein CcmE